MAHHSEGFQQVPEVQQQRWWQVSAAERKGKGSKGKGKEIRKELAGLQLAWRTPEIRELCFGYNAGNCNGNYDIVHQCQVKGCYGDHPAIKFMT